jgi:hypothetical protein
MGDVMEGAMQQAAQPGRQFMIRALVVRFVPPIDGAGAVYSQPTPALALCAQLASLFEAGA